MKKIAILAILLSCTLALAPGTSAAWLYCTETDPMTGGVTVMAGTWDITNDDPVATLAIRDTPQDGLSVMLALDHGCIVGDTVAIKFDDGKMAVLNISQSLGGCGDVVFLDPQSPDLNIMDLVLEIEQAQRILIQVTLECDGLTVYEFNAADFDRSKFVVKR
jgi:hypothetical protein